MTRTPAEKFYDEIIKNVVYKEKHVYTSPVSNTKTLFSVTTRAASLKFGGDRHVLITDSFDTAVSTLVDSGVFFWEYSYNLAVIEEFTLNAPYGGLDERPAFWFAFDKGERDEEGHFSDGRYRPIETPDAYKNVIGFCVG